MIAIFPVKPLRIWLRSVYNQELSNDIGGFYIDKRKFVYEVIQEWSFYIRYNMYDKFGNKEHGQGHMLKWNFAHMMQMRVKKNLLQPRAK